MRQLPLGEKLPLWNGSKKLKMYRFIFIIVLIFTTFSCNYKFKKLGRKVIKEYDKDANLCSHKYILFSYNQNLRKYEPISNDSIFSLFSESIQKVLDVNVSENPINIYEEGKQITKKIILNNNSSEFNYIDCNVELIPIIRIANRFTGAGGFFYVSSIRLEILLVKNNKIIYSIFNRKLSEQIIFDVDFHNTWEQLEEYRITNFPPDVWDILVAEAMKPYLKRLK